MIDVETYVNNYLTNYTKIIKKLNNKSRNIINSFDQDIEITQCLGLVESRKYKRKIESTGLMNGTLKNIDDNINRNEFKCFNDLLNFYISKYLSKNPNSKTSDIYKDYDISRQVFSTMCNDISRTPKRDNVIKLCFGLHLNSYESQSLMISCGYSFKQDFRDALLLACLDNKYYSLYDINDYLKEKGLEEIINIK